MYRGIVALPEILALGQVINSEPDRAASPNIRAIHTIEAPVFIAGKNVNFRATIRETTSGTFHYDLSVGSEARGFASPTVSGEPETSALQRDLASALLQNSVC